MNQFGSAKPASTGNAQHCAQFEAMLTDALDGTLTAEEQILFETHQAGCTTCSQTLADARRGAAWLDMLRTPRPEPPADLLEKILAQTSGLTSLQVESAGQPISIASSPRFAAVGGGDAGQVAARVIPFRSRIAQTLHLRALGHTLLQPRLAMTAAMAFFSVALTLNLTGVHLGDLHASDLRPSTIKRSVVQGGAHVVRYYDNLVVVYELESRVRDLQRSADAESTNSAAPANSSDSGSGDQKNDPNPKNDPNLKNDLRNDSQPAPATTPGEAPKQPRPRTGSGTSRRDDLGSEKRLFAAGTVHPLAFDPDRFRADSSLRQQHIQEGGLV